MKKKTLCLIIPSLQAGGMERVMAELAKYFCKRGDLFVHLILYGKEPGIFYQVPDEVIIHAPKTVFNDKYRMIHTIKRAFYLRDKVKEINPDSILSFGEYWNSLVLISLCGLSYPVFVSDRCSPETRFGTFHSLLRRFLYPRAAGVIAQTNTAKELYQMQFHADNVTVIGNPIRRIENYGPQYSEENVVLSVGRLVRSKHHDKLIELFSHVAPKGWKLVIVGDDSQKQSNMNMLKSLIAKLEMNEKVILAGNQSDVESYYLRSKIFAFTSSSEGFPNVIGEAMSAGLPVVSFDCVAGPKDLISDGKDGFLLPMFSYEMFQVRLKQLMENEELRLKLGAEARKSVRRFSLDVIGKKYYDFIFA